MCPTRFTIAFLLFGALAGSAAPALAAREGAESRRAKQYAKYWEIAGAERAGSDQCRVCHDNVTSEFRRTPHFQQQVECEDCHGYGSLHVASGNGSGKILKPRKESTEAANGLCLRCHADTERLWSWRVGAHARRGVRCSDCHSIHGREEPAGPVNLQSGLRAAETGSRLESRRERAAACERCHHKQQSEANLPYHHPVREGKMSCGDCHDPHGGVAGNNLRAASVNELCFTCHAEFQGPFAYQHAPVVESCLKCHTPHASPQANLLLVSQPMLCLQCHAAHHNGSTVPLTNRCTNCHSAVHGTDTPSATGGSVFMDK
jgi:DmsE family decaheme c-type cytochrome